MDKIPLVLQTDITITSLEQELQEILPIIDSEKLRLQEIASPNDSTPPSDTTENAFNGVQNERAQQGCGFCSTPVRVENMCYLKRGQHISVSGQRSTLHVPGIRRQLRFYKHHAIVKEVMSQSENKARVVLINMLNPEGIKQIEETFDLKFHELCVIEYVHPRYSPDEIVHRAEKALQGNRNEETFKEYEFFTRNCEHFALWCVVGHKGCYQLQAAREFLAKKILEVLDKVGQFLGKHEKITNFLRNLLQFCYNSLDESTAAVFGENTVCPVIALGLSLLAYIVYCIFMTYDFKKKHADDEMCGSCFKKKLIDLWLSLGVYVSSSALTFAIYTYAGLSTGITVTVVLGLLVLSTCVMQTLPSIKDKLRFPQCYTKRPVRDLREIHRGDVIGFDYFGFQHHLLVTETVIESNAEEQEKGKLSSIHYDLPNSMTSTLAILSLLTLKPRVIAENWHEIDLKKKEVTLFNCKLPYIFSAEETIKRARKRIGEAKWDSFDNRSDSVCLWAKRMLNQNLIPGSVFTQEVTDESRFQIKSSVFLKMEEVHLMDEIRPGDVLQLWGYGFHRNKGILVELTDNGEGRRFEMSIIILKDRVRLVTETVNLKTDNLFVKRYHPAHCHSMEERVERARNMLSRPSTHWTQLGFIEDCILINP